MSANHKETMAFPMQYADDSYQQGMTLRDYFAAKVMAALIPLWVRNVTDTADHQARAAYKIADAMLEARK